MAAIIDKDHLGTGHQYLPAGMVGRRAINPDKLAMVPRKEAARVASAALFAIQQEEHPEEFILGLGTLFAAVTLRAGLDPHDLYEMGKAVITAPPDHDKLADAQLQTIRDWVGMKVLAKEVTIG